MNYLVDCVIKTSAAMAVALVAVRLLRQQSAAVRHFVLLVSIIVAMLMPLLAPLMPSWHWPQSCSILRET